jgi:homoserine kinase
MKPGRFVVRAPATTANLGPGFDCAAAALDLWNELDVEPAETGAPSVALEGEGADELPRDESHLALRAFARVLPVERFSFRFVNRIPLERGLGSSAATVAAGVVAALIAAGRDAGLEEVLELCLPFEGHADNLVAALEGGVCLTWSEGGRRRARRIASGLPLAAIVVVPEGRVSTSSSRERLPESIRHGEAAAAAAQAALLGAGIAGGDAALLAAAFHDHLHEPYRMDDAPLLAQLRERPVEGSAGVTLSGSGPSVVVWAEPHLVGGVARELRARLPGARVLPLALAERGAHRVEEPAARLGVTA